MWAFSQTCGWRFAAVFLERGKTADTVIAASKAMMEITTIISSRVRMLAGIVIATSCAFLPEGSVFLAAKQAAMEIRVPVAAGSPWCVIANRSSRAERGFIILRLVRNKFVHVGIEWTPCTRQLVVACRND